MNLDDLKAQRRWVGYKSPTDKAPMNPHTGRNASSTDLATWATYAEATAAQARYRWHGVGFVLNGDGIVGIDLDDCLTEVDGAQERSKLARYIMDIAQSYTEVSPSGMGLHIIGTGTLERAIKDTINGDAIEVYSTGRYLTFTDDPLDIAPSDICDISDAINEIMDIIESAREQRMAKPAPIARESVSDDHLETVWRTWLGRIERIMQNATQGNRHNSRVKAGRLMGGALAALRQHGYNPMTDDHATQYIYDLLIPDQGEQRIEYRAIEDGIAFGQRSPLEVWKRRRSEDVSVAPAVEAQIVQKDPSDNVAKVHPYENTDVGNGLRFADAYRTTLAWVPEWQTWMHWCGTHWRRIDDATLRGLAHDLVLSMHRNAITAGRIDNEVAKWAIKSQSTGRIDAMLVSAQPYLIVSSELFDTHHDTINVGNGMVSLRDGSVRPHDPTWYFTKCIAVNMDDSASTLPWQDFLDVIFAGDQELIAYIQRAVGYTLTGSTDEHCLFFCYGTGKNGKSTFMKALEMLMQEFAVTTNVEALLDTSGGGEGATPHLSRLLGRRLAIAQEMPENRKMNESLVKSITGGDRIAARELYKDIFQFTPTHKLWISGNHKPRISGTDDGIWRRLRIVPFTVTIPEAKRRNLSDIMDEFKRHLPGILQWAVLGAMMWYQQGLRSCGAVDRATSEYRGEEDAVARFVGDRCELHPSANIDKVKLYLAWKDWAEDEGDRSAQMKSQRWLMTQLGKRFGCEAGGNGRRLIVGIRLSDADAINDHIAPGVRIMQ